MPISVPNLGSGRTTCKVLVHRHDRTKVVDNKTTGNVSDALDISSFVNKVSLAQNLFGGGSVTLSLIPAFPWEDEIAANDLVNIYLNTNRGDESSVYKEGDFTSMYNRGNVRVFFGYVDQISRSTSVGGVGTRVTNYTMTCSSFEKAIKSTTIYSNPQLSFQGDGTDSVRADISNNLGGLILLKKGFPIAGSPRHLIIAHLFRTLGFGGQWLLPDSYDENLDRNDIYEPKNFKPWVVGWTQKKRNKEEIEESGRFPYYFSPKLEQGTPPQNGGADIVCRNTSFKYFSKTHWITGLPSKAKQDFISALEMVGDSSATVSLSNVGAIQKALSELVTNEGGPNKNTFLRYIHGLKQKLLLRGSGIYWIGSGTGGKLETLEKEFLEKLGTVLTTKIRTDVYPGTRTTKITMNYDNKFWRSYIQTKEPEVSPYINNTTDPNGDQRPAKTLFNILCLDYMEDVDGNYVMSEMYNFGGPLSSQLQRQSNELISELFYDLRVVPDFKVRTKDGLGVELDEALPTVPAVIHREKPYTNYDASLSPILNKSEQGKTSNNTRIKVGRYDPNKTGGVNASDDQLFLETAGLKSYRSIVGDLASLNKIKGTLQSVGVTKFPKPAVKKGTAKSKKKPKKTKSGKSKVKSKVVPLDTKGTTKSVFQFQAKIGGKLRTLATKPYNLVFSLPRPVFRSPDDHRVTEEQKIASMDAILGFIEKTGDKTRFVAFGTTSNPSNSVENKSGETTWTKGTKGNSKKKRILTAPFAGDEYLRKQEDPQSTWHILDYMTIRNEDVITESYSRGDFSVANIRELHLDLMPDFEVQRATVADILPIITPVSIYRSGIRPAPNNSTSFIQYMLTGGTTDRTWHQSLGLRWAVMLDLWEQHNHEYLAGSLTVRGMPGLRVGYRIDRKELDLSFYVQSVSHTWEYPGVLSTQISVTRGQSIKKGKILKYYQPEPHVNSNVQQRIELGRIFRSSKAPAGQELGTGALTNLKKDINNLKVDV